MIPDADKNAKLFEYLDKLLLNQINDATALRKWVDDFTNLYGPTPSFRHSYSEFYPWLLLKTAAKEDSAETLLENLRMINEAFPDDDMHANAGKCVFKLYDHLNIEIARLKQQYNLIHRQEELKIDLNRQEMDAEKYREELFNARDMLKKHEDDINKANKKLADSHNDIITVLSLFSGIIIAFFGGLNYISAAISSVASSNVWRLSLICTIAGFVIFNTLVSMLYLVSRILGQNIWTFCRKEKISGSCEQCKKNCRALGLIFRRMSLVFWIDFILIAVGIFSAIQIIF